MAQVVIAPAASDDIARLFDFLAQRDLAAAAQAVELIEDGVMLLERHPAIGRPVERGLRELVISHGATGYLALYDFKQVRDLVIVLKVRHQREIGYS